MRVSLSTLVEILKVTKSSVSGSTPRFILRRAQESHGISINFLICAIVMLLILLLVLSAAVMLLQGLLENNICPIGHQLEAPIHHTDRYMLPLDTKIEVLDMERGVYLGTEEPVIDKDDVEQSTTYQDNYSKELHSSTDCLNSDLNDCRRSWFSEGYESHLEIEKKSHLDLEVSYISLILTKSR